MNNMAISGMVVYWSCAALVDKGALPSLWKCDTCAHIRTTDASLFQGRSRYSPTLQPAVASDPIADLLPNLARFIEDGGVTVGIVDPVGCVTTAADEHASIAMLVRRKNETLTQLMTRLDYA
jgi:hypothetical protein